MAIPTSKSTFKEYCLRNLGKGVIDINVSDDQADDRIDEALQYFAQYHYDGIEKMYLKYQITQEDVDRAASNDTTSATDTVDNTITASFTEGKNFIPMPSAVISDFSAFVLIILQSCHNLKNAALFPKKSKKGTFFVIWPKIVHYIRRFIIARVLL